MQKKLIENTEFTSYQLPATSHHVPVLLKEVIEVLDLKKGDTVLDCTINDGGHALAVCQAIGEKGLLVGIDEDKGALERARNNLALCKTEIILEESNFRNLDLVLEKSDVSGVDKILFDFGLSSNQLETSGRGFSFQNDEPLLMTFAVIPKIGQLTALEVVNSWSEEDLSDIIREYGEERFSRRIASAIVEARKKGLIGTTAELKKIIEKVVPSRLGKGKIHPATRTFQAIRIAVNDELEAIREGLGKATKKLNPGGRIAAISFHSLEDRIVKQYWRELTESGKFRIVTKKPITPSREEEIANPRSRSAKLRAIEKI
ncbi:MAG: 16S rRNA (cytosine(1402)-N(4))-methyltransferase RsmH [Patescibacteria group bacterium]